MVVLLGLVAIGLVSAPLAAAHSDLESTAPAMDEVLADPPSTIRLNFNIEVAERGLRVQVRDATGAVIATAAPVRLDATTVEAAITGPMPAGGQNVRWSVIAADGHRVSGRYGFTVERGTPPASEEDVGVAAVEPADPPTVADSTSFAEPSRTAEIGATVARSIGYIALLLLIGAVLVGALVAPALGRLDPERRIAAVVALSTRRVTVLALGLLLLASLLAIPLQARADALTIGEIMEIRAGRAAALTAFLTIAALVVFALYGRRRGARGVAVVFGVLVAALSVSPVLTGHSATASIPVALVDWVHVLAAGAWAGGVLTLALLAARLLRIEPADLRARAVTLIIHGFTRIALVGLALLVVSGAITTVVMVGSPLNLVDSTWGIVLIAKVATVAGAVLLAGLARRGTSFDVGVRLEAGVLLGAIVLTGVLTGLNP